jgi:hypothetical protein
MSPAESLKSTLAPIRVSITAMSTGGGALYGSVNGPWLGGQTVRDLAQRLGFLPDEPYGPRLGVGWSARAQGRRSSPNSTWISLPGGTPSGRKDPRVVLGLASYPRCL